MPSLRHHRAGEQFNILESDAVAWLIEQPEVRQWVFNVLKRHGAIQFDTETHCWRGTAWSASRENGSVNAHRDSSRIQDVQQ
jgi:hypothetical protein